MTVTRPQLCEIPLGVAEPDDHGNVRIVATTAFHFTPDEAREFAAEITAAAAAADAYQAEQAADRG